VGEKLPTISGYGGNSNIFDVHPEPWGNDDNLTWGGSTTN